MAASSSCSINQLKIVLVGDSATGKHCYVRRLTHNIFPNDTRTNKEYDIISTKIKIDEYTEIPIEIFNISGSQCDKTKLKTYFNNIDGYIIMFDITRRETYDNIINWKNSIDNVNQTDNLPCLLFANKCDLEDDQILNPIMNNYCQINDFCGYYKISNKNNINIEQSIQTLINEIIQRRNLLTRTSPSMSISRNRTISIEEQKQEYTLKIIVIGERATGKTAFIQRYVNNTFAGIYHSTIGTDLAVKKIQYNDHIIDIAGDERFGTMTHLFYKDAAGCLIVFDVSKSTTLINGAVKWKIDFDNKVNIDNNNQVSCLLIGNKCDLVKDGIVVSETHMTEFCRKHKFIRWYETSARENINIEESILFLVKEIMKNINTMKSIRRRLSEVIEITQQTSSTKPNISYCCQF
ncbi:unnamed protein product [Rotaria sordida]|uniref:Uncharacterized protein n=1 Tax=Rotaria sordida TaxID=392033 RepID=A0A813WCL6_9BILA|nr:unnamed protein product [Rotaria sordida]CAF3656629.1 unnamed protein product [Rotaria sordida]